MPSKLELPSPYEFVAVNNRFQPDKFSASFLESLIEIGVSVTCLVTRVSTGIILNIHNPEYLKKVHFLSFPEWRSAI